MPAMAVVLGAALVVDVVDWKPAEAEEAALLELPVVELPVVVLALVARVEEPVVCAEAVRR